VPSAQPDFWLTTDGLWLLAAGPITLVPLVSFNAAARHLPYTTLGFLQYLAPTLVLLLAVFKYHEPLGANALVAFGFIWAGLILYSIDAVVNLRRKA